MNYIKYAQDNQKKLGFRILSIHENIITLQCTTCQSIRNMQLKSLYRNRNSIHNQFCSKYFLQKIRKEYGAVIEKKFHATYRYAHERCCNPACKDYPKYKGLFGFSDFTEYYHTCFLDFMESAAKFGVDNLSIDRIDGSLGYQPGNVRFVPMSENLRNKKNVRPVRMTNVKTGQEITAASFGELARKYKDISYAASLHRSCKAQRLYKNEWRITYIETESTIETQTPAII